VEDKKWYESKTIWGGLLAVIATIIPLVGRMGVEGLTGDAVQIAGGLAAVIGGAVAIYGRYKAASAIGK